MVDIIDISERLGAPKNADEDALAQHVADRYAGDDPDLRDAIIKACRKVMDRFPTQTPRFLSHPEIAVQFPDNVPPDASAQIRRQFQSGLNDVISKANSMRLELLAQILTDAALVTRLERGYAAEPPRK